MYVMKNDKRKSYYKGKYLNQWHVVAAFLLAVAVVVVMAMNGFTGV
jgi:thiosulfate reductase cytochrome b subunit